jgi:hypothetical protein
MRKMLIAILLPLIGPVAFMGQTPSPQSLSPQALSSPALSPQVRSFVKVDAPVIALTHVRVIDGTGAPAREEQTIVLSQGKIESVSDGASASSKVPSDAQVLDLHGYTVIPGLVGMHDHMFYPMGNGIFGEMAFSFPRLYLAGGVTTIRTTGSIEPYTDLELKKQIDEGKTPGPKIHPTGPYLEGAGHFCGADASTHRIGRRNPNGQSMAGSWYRQFQGLHVHYSAGAFRRGGRGPQKGR